jgi:hypothetical protein
MLARRASSATLHIRVLAVTETPADQANPGSTVLNGADPIRVGRWLAERLGKPAWRDCSITGIGRGRSNLAFRVTSSADMVVLRRARQVRRWSTQWATWREGSVPREGLA